MKAGKVGNRLVLLMLLGLSGVARAQQPGSAETSYLPVAVKDGTAAIQERMQAAKPAIMARQMDLLGARYDLSDRPAAGVTMSRGKPIQEGVRTKLPAGTSWES